MDWQCCVYVPSEVLQCNHVFCIQFSAPCFTVGFVEIFCQMEDCHQTDQ